jgi:hypothetical protein
MVHDGTQGNAMTEIALAMAMGFFSIMVLTALSMGVAPETSKIISAAQVAQSETDASKSGAVVTRADDLIAIFAQGRFHDVKLQPLDPARIPVDRRVILVVDPQLPMTDVLAARARIGAKDLVVSTMDKKWRKAVAGLGR